MNKLNNFNLLRFLLASLVIVSHAPELMDGGRGRELLTRAFGTISFGELAVDGFFILSGFLITKSWDSTKSVSKYTLSRALRIYPGFIASAPICTLIIGPIFSEAGFFESISLRSFLVGLATLKFNGVPHAFEGTNYPFLNGSLWSVHFELLCYCLVLLLGVCGLLTRRTLSVATFSLLTCVHIYSRSRDAGISYDLHVRVFMAFFAGVVLYNFRDILVFQKKVMGVLAAMVSLVALLNFKEVAEPAVCVFFGYLMMQFAVHNKTFLWFNRLPDVSYGVYLYAWPINKMLLWFTPEMDVYASMASVLLISVLAGIASWYLVERPFLKYKDLFAKKSENKNFLTSGA